jgi:thiol-disulfide isomerase/thioredoxin
MSRSKGAIALLLAASALFATRTFQLQHLAAQTPQGAGANAQVSFPKPTSTTPSGCLDEVKAYAASRQKDVPPAGGDAVQALSNQARSALLQQISASRLAMTKACAAQFDPKTVDAAELAALIQLYGDANTLDQAQIALDRALPMKSMQPAGRATLVATAIPIVRRITPPNSDRPWRVANLYPKVEALVDELDANGAATFDQKWSTHSTMESVYRGDDIDSGIIKHGNWIVAAASTFTPDERKKYGSTVVSAHINMAEAYAGQAMNDKALALLRSAKADWKDAVAAVDDRVDPTLHRYELVGTAGAAIQAPAWLNAPAGTTELAMPGTVTLLEFTAHWCGPCRESYPGINRLRERFKGQNFRVVMATRLWGYFGSERNLAADAEIAHDKDYFAEHKLDVPVAIGEYVKISSVNGKIVYTPGPDPNDTAYGVSGIPQIHLIDKKGRIRLIMVGYDNTNEEKLAKLIETMLNEK